MYNRINNKLIIVVTTGKAKVLTNKKATMLYWINFAKCHASQNIGKYLKKSGLFISDCCLLKNLPNLE